MTSRRTPAQWIVTILLLGLFLVTISPLLAPVALGLFIAVVCYPLQIQFLKKKFSPDLAALLVTTLVSLVVVLPLVFLGITVIQEAAKFVTGLEDARARGSENDLILSMIASGK
jgi:predicted PurR-regulated permease PerM